MGRGQSPGTALSHLLQSNVAVMVRGVGCPLPGLSLPSLICFCFSEPTEPLSDARERLSRDVLPPPRTEGPLMRAERDRRHARHHPHLHRQTKHPKINVQTRQLKEREDPARTLHICTFFFGFLSSRHTHTHVNCQIFFLSLMRGGGVRSKANCFVQVFFFFCWEGTLMAEVPDPFMQRCRRSPCRPPPPLRWKAQ